MENEHDQQRAKIVLLVDMDCFYVQVEQREEPSSRGKPCAVVQYKQFKGGSILAVGYEARKFGVTRMLKGDEAKVKCPGIIIFKVPEKRGKGDLTKYRLAGAEVIKVLSRYADCVERASIDEAFLDITSLVTDRLRLLQQTHTEGLPLITSSMLPATHVAGYSVAMETKCSKGHTAEELSALSDFINESTALTSCSEDQVDVDDDDLMLCDFECDEQSDWLEPTDSNHSFEDTTFSKENITTIEGEEEKTTDPPAATQPQASREQLMERWLSSDGFKQEQLLAVAAMLTNEIREAVTAETGFTCSAGISHNKMLAKLAAGMNKPNQQTIAPFSSVNNLMDITPITKVRHLGGKFGEQLTTELGLTHMGQLRKFSKVELRKKFGTKQGTWLYQLCRGIDHEKVKLRHLAQSVGCGKNFIGPEKLMTAEEVQYWLLQFAKELEERLSGDLKTNHRRATSLSVYYRHDIAGQSVSRSCPLDTYDAQAVSKLAWNALCRSGKNGNSITSSWHVGITNLSMNATKFVKDTSQYHTSSLRNYLHPSPSPLKNTSCQSSECQQTFGNSKTASHDEEVVENRISRSLSLGDVDEQVLNSLPDHIREEVLEHVTKKSSSGSVNKNQSMIKVVSGKSKKSLKRTSGGIENYFTSSASKVHKSNEAQHLSSDIVSNEKTLALSNTTVTDTVVLASESSNHCHQLLQDNSDSAKCSTSLKSSVASVDDNEPVMIYCDGCGENVPAYEWVEHTDYHVAMQLQSSFKASASSKTLSSPQSVVRQKSHSKSSKSKGVLKKSNVSTLDKFFTKK